MNKVIIVGRLAQNPEVHYTQSGKAVASFTVAVNRRVNGQDLADFIPVVVWEKLAEVCGNNLAKGRRVLVDGRLQIRMYETAAAEKRRVAEVVANGVEFLDRTKSDGQLNDLLAEFGKDVGDLIMEEIPY